MIIVAKEKNRTELTVPCTFCICLSIAFVGMFQIGGILECNEVNNLPFI